MSFYHDLAVLDGWEYRIETQGVSFGQPPVPISAVRNILKADGRGWFTFIEVLTNDPYLEVRIDTDNKEIRFTAAALSSAGVTLPVAGVPNVTAFNRYISGLEGVGPLSEMSYFGNQAPQSFNKNVTVTLNSSVPNALAVNYVSQLVLITNFELFKKSYQEVVGALSPTTRAAIRPLLEVKH